MHYKSDIDLVFASVEYILRDVHLFEIIIVFFTYFYISNLNRMIFAMLRLHIETEGNFYTEKKGIYMFRPTNIVLGVSKLKDLVKKGITKKPLSKHIKKDEYKKLTKAMKKKNYFIMARSLKLFIWKKILTLVKSTKLAIMEIWTPIKFIDCLLERRITKL